MKIGIQAQKAILCGILAILLCAVALASCGRSGQTEETTLAVSTDSAPHGNAFYAQVSDLSPYVILGPYTGLTVSCGAGEDREDAVWRAVESSAPLLSVPEGEVAYYYRSLCAQYRYLASLKELSYEELLSSLSLSDAALRAQAEQMARKDLVFAAVVRESGIALTESEKETLFSKYVDKFVTEYGYSREHASTELRELIYETMLYDKVTEFLLANNTVSGT